jgi:transcriptional regulator with XRE-family HTH domain
MDRFGIGRRLRVIRRLQGWRQEDVASRARLSRSAYARLESGDINGVRLGVLERVTSALDADLDVAIRWHGARLDRAVDEGHARLAGLVARLLLAWGWIVELEVSFSHFGERGSIDLLGWHAATASLLVDETKTELGSVEGLLRPLDVKVRLAPMLARQRFGWQAARVGRVVVFPESVTVRRQVARHRDVLDAALPDGSRDVRRWLRQPAGPLRGIWFLSSSYLVKRPTGRPRAGARGFERPLGRGVA